MSEKRGKFVQGTLRKTQCFFCNTLLVSPSVRNSRDIFKTIIVSLDRKASDLIGDLLDIVLEEETAHSRHVCLNCFQMVAEFAELEARAGQIRSEMLTSYMSSRKAFDDSQGPIETVEDESSQEGGETATIKLDAAKLNQLVAEASGGNLKIKGGSASDRPKLLVVNSDEYEEYQLRKLLQDDDDEEMEEEDEDAEGDADDSDEDMSNTRVIGATKLVDDLYVCQLCSEGEGNTPFSTDISQINLMKIHFQQEHSLKCFFCGFCGDAFPKKAALMVHLQEHDSTAKLSCDQCDRTFTNQRLYRVHKKQHANSPKAWACEICGKKYSSRNLLEEHMNSHLGVRPYNCTTCGKAFSSKYTFKAHLKIHKARERNFGCTTCGKSFMTQQNLQQHIKTHSEIRDHVCNICGKGFGTLRNLEVHSVVHSGLKPYVCSFCNKGFARKAEIKDHERTHTGEKPFVCEHCGGQFSQRSNLQSHKRVTHMNDRRYVCNSCGKGFKRKRLLDYHVKAVHTGERPYTCGTCDATFVYPEHYKKHIRIHTGIKPYKCEVCDKAFNSRDNRNAHRFVHSDKKPYECVVCGVGFMRKPLLYTHMHQAGHENDTIVVNQPRMEKTDEEPGEQEMLIVDETQIRKIMNKKVYLANSDEHVVIQGSEKTLFAKLDDGNLKALTTVGGTKQLLDEDGNLIDLDDNMISIEELEEDDRTMTAHFNEKGQLVNEDGQIISEETLIVDESIGDDDDGSVQIKTEGNVQYVRVEVPEGENPREWLKLVKSETIE